MNPIRRRLAPFVVAALLLGGAVASPVSASSIVERTGLSQAAEPTGLTNACRDSTGNCVAEIVGRLLNVALGFVGIVLLVLFIAGGFLWMTAGGDVEKVKKARTMLVNAVAGLIIIGLSYAVTSFVLEQLGTAVGGGGGGEAVDCSDFDTAGNCGAGKTCSTPAGEGDPLCTACC